MSDNQIKDVKKKRHNAVQRFFFLDFAMERKRNMIFFSLKKIKTLYNEQHDKTFSVKNKPKFHNFQFDKRKFYDCNGRSMKQHKFWPVNCE